MPGDHIRIMCPSLTCRRVLAVPANSRGKNVRCKGCGATIRVPEKAPSPAAASVATPAPQAAPATPNAKAA
ncbi:MAG: hypothetical protein KF869_11765 [Phycisphaeraceae bacterium]|nr:hypothetical protein [Phycisphaeraceae bacterium]